MWAQVSVGKTTAEQNLGGPHFPVGFEFFTIHNISGMKGGVICSGAKCEVTVGPVCVPGRMNKAPVDKRYPPCASLSTLLYCLKDLVVFSNLMGLL